MTFPRGMPSVRVEAAWEVDTMTRPGPSDWVRIDGPPSMTDRAALRSMTTSRGARLRTGDFEAGSATLVFDNRNRNLDPTYTAGEWYPNVTLRKRVRVVAEPVGDDLLLTEDGDTLIAEDGDTLTMDAEFSLFTGFVDSLRPSWVVGDHTVTMVLTDLGGIISAGELPPSVVHAVSVLAEPDAYWPMTETQGTIADDVVGDSDATWIRPISETAQLVPFDTQRVQVGKSPNDGGDPTGFFAQTDFIEPNEFTVRLWCRFIDRADAAMPMYVLEMDTLPRPASGPRPVFIFGATTIGGSEGGAFIYASDGTAFSVTLITDPNLLFDTRAHHIVLVADDSTVDIDDATTVYIDGVEQPWVAQAGAIDWQVVMASINATFFGMPGVGGEGVSFAMGHYAAWRHALTADEIAADYAASAFAWDGDTSAARLGRILDLASVDPDDRDLLGDRVCSGTSLGGTVGGYLRRIANTEEGAVYVGPDGRIRLASPSPSAPTATVYAGNPDDGVPYASLRPSFGVERLVNVANVRREGGPDLVARDTASVDLYGAAERNVDTLLQSSSVARGMAERIVDAGKAPRQVIEELTLRTIRAEAQVAALGADISHLVTVETNPTGPGAGTPITARIERVEHEVDFRAKSWSTRLGLDQIT